MVSRARSLSLIDHHRSAIEDLKPLIDSRRIAAWVDVNHSGAMLAWEWFNGVDRAPQLLHHIEDRDLWRFALPNTAEIQANVFSHPYDFEVWDELMKTPVEKLIPDGAAILRKQHKDVAELIAKCTRTFNIGGYQVPIANLPYTLSSDAGHILAKDKPFAGCYYDTPEGRVFSLRSANDGLDVDKVAKLYGGGGHPHAAGFRVPYGHELCR